MQINTERFTITKSEQADKKYIDEQIHNFNKAHVPYLSEKSFLEKKQ